MDGGDRFDGFDFNDERISDDQAGAVAGVQLYVPIYDRNPTWRW